MSVTTMSSDLDTVSLPDRAPLLHWMIFTGLCAFAGVLLWQYGIKADNVQTDINALKQKLRDGHKIIAILNAETIWNRPGKRNSGNHFVVVTGIDTRSGVVHLNDSANPNDADETVSIGSDETNNSRQRAGSRN